MKTSRVLSVLFLTTALSWGIVSCGDDDPEPVQQQTEADDKEGTDDKNDTDERQDTLSKHESVDLGLPSGTKWATCNIGATSPEEYGDYFAWGETKGYNSGKTTFDWSTYKYCKGGAFALTKYCNDTSDGYNGFVDTLTELLPEDDAAYANWGSEWHMPSYAQLVELTDTNYITMKPTTQNSVLGYKITSKTNGKSIFLPAAGMRDDTLEYMGEVGSYWSRTLDNTRANFYAHSLLFYDERMGLDWDYSKRCHGKSIRPVRASY